jgi:hypothetical protein
VRARIEAFVNRLPEVFYSWDGFFPGPIVPGIGHSDFNFPIDTELKDLLDSEGNMILFRNIAGPYTPKFEGEIEKNFIQGEGGMYSYSLSPAIVKEWAYNDEGKVRTPGDYPDGNKFIGKNAVTLIAVQNLKQDLYYKNYENGVKQERLHAGFQPATSLYNEVKVPIAQENVVLTISQRRFAEALDSFGGKGQRFTLRNFFRKVLEDPSISFPNCDALRALPHSRCSAAFSALK